MPHVESLEDLPAVYYAWVENVCAQEPEELTNPDTGEIDENQNNVWAVYLGLTNLGYLNYMKQMGKNMILKKKLIKKQRKLQAAAGADAEPTKAMLKVKASIKKLDKKDRAILKKGNEYKENNVASARYAYVQFQSMNGKDKFIKALDINCCKRCILRCQKKQDVIAHKYLAGKWPTVLEAPDPTLILWENLGKGRIEKCGRSTISNVLAFLLLMVGFISIIYLMNVRAQYTFDVTACGEKTIDETTAVDSFKQFGLNTDLNNCYCLQEFKKLKEEVKSFTFSSIQGDGSLVKPCERWLTDYNKAGQLGIIISISIVAINTVLRESLRASSKFEGHYTVSEKLSSSFSKMWVLQFLNTAIILIIINNRLSPNGLITTVTKATGTSGFLFNGDYSDFNTEWYALVGITIFTNAFIGGITPVSGLSAYFIGLFKRCLDRGCSKDIRKTKKIMQAEYEAVYTGQLIQYDTRFSMMIAMIWVIMMFAAAIPMLYLAGFILCFTLYWTDKTLFVKFYRTPPKHGSTLAHQVRSIVEWSLIMHLFMGLYMLSNPEIFSSEEDDNDAVAFFQIYAKFVALGISFLTGVDSDRFG